MFFAKRKESISGGDSITSIICDEQDSLNKKCWWRAQGTHSPKRARAIFKLYSSRAQELIFVEEAHKVHMNRKENKFATKKFYSNNFFFEFFVLVENYK